MQPGLASLGKQPLHSMGLMGLDTREVGVETPQTHLPDLPSCLIPDKFLIVIILEKLIRIIK